MNSTNGGVRVEVNRGPNWLFLRLEPCETSTAESLAEQVWSIVSKHFVYRVVLEFGPGFKSLLPETIAELDEIRHRLEEHDGALRVCGLNKTCAERLASYCAESKLRSRLTSHSTVVAAVFGAETAVGDVEPITQDTAYEALRVH